ncbi:MAG: hypothetical protein WCC17_22180 [Candidatus Nitrosopolaris sp.]|jgi:hypothetical protein
MHAAKVIRTILSLPEQQDYDNRAIGLVKRVYGKQTTSNHGLVPITEYVGK